MPDLPVDPLPALIKFITDTGFIAVNCFTQYDPPRVEIDMVGGLQILIDYNQYQEIRKAAGLPDDVCTNEDED